MAAAMEVGWARAQGGLMRAMWQLPRILRLPWNGGRILGGRVPG